MQRKTKKILEDVAKKDLNTLIAEWRGSGLRRICNETKKLESYTDDRKPVFKSSPSQFITIIYSMDYEREGTKQELSKGTSEETSSGQVSNVLFQSVAEIV